MLDERLQSLQMLSEKVFVVLYIKVYILEIVVYFSTTVFFKNILEYF